MILAVLLALGGCGGVGRTGSGQHVASEHPRVMSLNPCIDAVLVQVADPAQIVSISHYSRDPAASSIPPAVARRFPVNDETAEEVVASRPDLVLLGPHVAPATRAAIRAAGVRVESIGVPDSIAASRAQVLRIARAAGHEARGRALVARIDAALAAARPLARTAPVSALIRTSDGLVPGKGTLADDLLARTGFRNMSAVYGLAQWDILPLEPLIAHPPRLILTDLSRPGSHRALLARLPGVRLADFPVRLLRCAGPNLVEAAARLAAIRRHWGAS